MLMKQKGIIIKSVDYGESDKIITILNEYGAKIPLMARRAKKVKSGLQANTQLFVYGLFIYNKWRGMGTLNSVDVINQHMNSNSTYLKVAMHLYVLKQLTDQWKRMRFQNIIMTYFNLFFPKLTKEPLHN